MPATKALRPTESPHIFLDDKGRPWIGDTAYRVSMVVREYGLPDGYTPEQIAEAHYHELTLAQIHAALSYYYEHKAAIDEEIEEEHRYFEESRAKAEADPNYQALMEKFRRAKKAMGYDTPS